jgi:polyphosphate kinase
MRSVKSKRSKPQAPTWEPGQFLNREMSWLAFNLRVLEEAANPANPLLERAKFLAIFESNLDEFYMVRVSGLIEQFDGGVTETTPDGLTPHDQLGLISERVGQMRHRAAALWASEIQPQLREEGVSVLRYEDLSDKQREDLNELFLDQFFPICTPLLLDPAPNIPFISNRSLNLVVELEDESGQARLARVKIPDTETRLLRISKRKHEYLLLEELVRHNLHLLFPGVTVKEAHLFRVLRDADFEIRELEAGDLIETVEKTLRKRRFGDPVLLELESSCPKKITLTLQKLHGLDASDVVRAEGLIGFGVLWDLAAIEKPALRFPPFHPFLDEDLGQSDRLFAAIRETDILVHHPFDSFQSVEQFVASAARDPQVIGIKQTLYRVGAKSPIVESLLEAAEAGKQVAVMVELKARFDESNNLVWARALERAGAHVTYGFLDLKTHCKMCLIVRRENGGLRTYAHLGTGNYNPNTARLYTDLGLFTDDADICHDALQLFNYLTGFSKVTQYRKLLVAPINLRDQVLEKIEREIEAFQRTGIGHLILKMNALSDPLLIQALYKASQAGVQIDLIIRGICCLRPGVPGLSETIRVVSVVGRFLEHSRILYFQNGDSPEIFIGSADLMRRNLDRRVEVLTPVTDPDLIEYLREDLLAAYLRDSVNAWELNQDGTYSRRETDESGFSAHRFFMAHPATEELYG